MSIIDQIREGDLVEAVKGEDVIRGRARLAGEDYMWWIGASGRSAGNLEALGFTLTVVEKAAPPLPTEPGLYVDKDGDPWRFLGGRPLNREWAPYTRLEPVPETVKRVADYLRGYGRRLAADDVEEHFGVTS